jgi:group I intron endonuclease
MYYTVYKTTNKINGKIYIGSHKTKRLDDDYLGSGKYLKYAIEKYGADNFVKEVLFVFDTPEEMYAKEAELVTEDFIAEYNTYNLKVGGFGGFDYLNRWVNNPSHSPEHMRRMNEVGREARTQSRIERFSDPEYKIMWGKMSSRNQTQQYIQGRVPGMLNKKHTEETKRKISVANSERQSGSRNSQFGTMWITDGVINKKISKDSDIPLGWTRGRS